MRRRVLLANLVSIALAALVIAAPAGAASFSFSLSPPNTARDPSSGDTITVSGAGAFDTVAHTVNASGSFVHRDPNGALVARGTWTATAFDDFLSFGGPNNGLQGGRLSIAATFFPRGEAPVTGVPMTIWCDINAPPAFEHVEGTQVGDFTEMISGFTLFNLHDDS